MVCSEASSCSNNRAIGAKALQFTTTVFVLLVSEIIRLVSFTPVLMEIDRFLVSGEFL